VSSLYSRILRERDDFSLLFFSLNRSTVDLRHGLLYIIVVQRWAVFVISLRIMYTIYIYIRYILYCIILLSLLLLLLLLWIMIIVILYARLFDPFSRSNSLEKKSDQTIDSFNSNNVCRILRLFLWWKRIVLFSFFVNIKFLKRVAYIHSRTRAPGIWRKNIILYHCRTIINNNYTLLNRDHDHTSSWVYSAPYSPYVLYTEWFIKNTHPLCS